MHARTHFALFRAELRAFALRDALIGAIQRLALRKVRLIGGEQRQAGVVAGAQRLRIQHGIQMADRRPDARDAVLQLFERLDHAGEGGLGDARELAIDARRPRPALPASRARRARDGCAGTAAAAREREVGFSMGGRHSSRSVPPCNMRPWRIHTIWRSLAAAAAGSRARSGRRNTARGSSCRARPARRHLRQRRLRAQEDHVECRERRRRRCTTRPNMALPSAARATTGTRSSASGTPTSRGSTGSTSATSRTAR